MGVLVGGTLLAWIVSVGLSFVPILGWIIGFVILGGVDYMFLRRIRGEDVEIGDVFAGFNLAFVNLALAGLVKWLLVTIGLILCILPGIYLAVGYVFALPLVIDKKMEFWPAMEVSRRVVHAALVVDVRAGDRAGAGRVRGCARLRGGAGHHHPAGDGRVHVCLRGSVRDRQQATSEPPMVTSPIVSAAP